MRSLIFLLLLSFNASAALYDRSNGLIYDDVLDITWLQDANYAQTSGYVAQNETVIDAANRTPNDIWNNGEMGWEAALNWTQQLEYEGFNNWRLPSASENPQAGFNQSSSELGHMFYVNLGNSQGFGYEFYA